MVLEVASDEVNSERLAELQRAGREGLLAQALAALIVWLARRLEGVATQGSALPVTLGTFSKRFEEKAAPII